MNKSTFFAFALILLTIMFFTSDFYSKKILKRPATPEVTIPKQQKDQEQVKTEKSEDSGARISQMSAMRVAAIDTAGKTPNRDAAHTALSGDTIWVENEKYSCGISEAGARIISLKMKEYGYNRVNPNLSDSKELVDLVARPSEGGGNLSIDGENFDEKAFKLLEKKKHIAIKTGETATCTFSCISSNGAEIQKRYTFEGGAYKIGLEVLSGSLDGKHVSVGWHCGITESEAISGQEGKSKPTSYLNEQRKVHVFEGKSAEHIQDKKPAKDERTGFYKWAAVTSKYFMVALVADTVKDANIVIDAYDAQANDDIKPDNKKTTVIDYSLSYKRVGDNNREAYWIFAGPSKQSLLRSYHVSFEKVLFGGWEILLKADIWFPFICEITLWLLVYFNNIVKDYGITIIILTVLIRLITYPLSQSSMKSMNRMKLLQPKINHLRERYKTNQKKMNEEIMALYREEGVNPLNPGCLPMFLQMPILFALFYVLSKAIELRGAHTLLVPWVKDLSQPEILISLTPWFPNGIPLYGYGIALMPIAMAILTFFQNKMTIKDPNQKAMIYFMPVFMLVLFNNFPAGLVLYWTFSNALGIVQQYILNKSMEKEAVKIQISTEKRPQLSNKKKNGQLKSIDDKRA